MGAFISSPAVFQEVLVGYGLERYLALIGRRLDYRAEDYPLTFRLRIEERFALGIGEKLRMIEAVDGKALRYDGHTFEAELIEQCAVGRGRKIALPRDVEDVEDEDILPFQSVNIRLDAVAEDLALHGERTSRPGMVGA